MNNEVFSRLDSFVQRRNESLLKLRRNLHANPEVAGAEYETTRMIAEFLTKSGISVFPKIDETGLIVDLNLGPGTDAMPVGLRADIDAVPISDIKQVSYHSQNMGAMHACGHDVHSSSLCGALVALNDMNSAGQLPFGIRVRAIFQPAEETALGAKEMIRRGAIEDVDAIFAIHVDPTRLAGHIGLRPAENTAHCDEVMVTIHGRGGHAARPHEVNDPIAAAAQLVNLVYTMIPRSIDSRESCVVTFGQICGGSGPNIVPDTVNIQGTMRNLDTDTRLRAKQILKNLASSLEKATNTRIEMRFGLHVPAVVNNPVVVDVARKACNAVVGAEHVEHIEKASLGGEDFSFYLERVPGALIRIGSAKILSNITPLHSSNFDVDEHTVACGANVYAMSALHWQDPARKLD